ICRDRIHVDLFASLAALLEVFGGQYEADRGSSGSNGYEPDPSPPQAHDLDVGSPEAVRLGPLRILPVVPERDVLQRRRDVYGDLEGSTKLAGFAGAVHVVACLYGV